MFNDRHFEMVKRFRPLSNSAENLHPRTCLQNVIKIQFKRLSQPLSATNEQFGRYPEVRRYRSRIQLLRINL